MKSRFLIIIYLLASMSFISGQDESAYLHQVSENNPEILAYAKLLKAKELEARTGLTPADPIVSFGYMPGNSAALGTKKVWSVSQSFSFPTKYLLQKKISKNTIALAETEFDLVKLMILLEAKLTVTDLRSVEESLSVLRQRKAGYDSLMIAWEKMLESGEATIIAYNKIRMELSSLSLDINRKEAERSMLRSKLLFMGGENAQLPENSYYQPFTEPEPNPEKLISDKGAIHPAFIIPEQEYLLNSGEVNLSKAEGFPEFQIGYSSEIIPGETYAGTVAGLSIPLWSNSNRVKTAVAMKEHSAAMRDAELMKLKSGVMMEYAEMKALKKSIDEMSDMMQSGDNKKLLKKALINGEITLTTYFSDLSVTYEIEDRLLEMKSDYNKSLVRLYDHELIKQLF